jgi:iron complex outermembrane recepter protein
MVLSREVQPDGAAAAERRPASTRAFYRCRRAIGCLPVLAVTLCSPVSAQPATVAQQPALEEIVVTGSRIPVPANITATSPMQVVTSEDIALAGRTDAVDVLNALPQTTISAGNDFGNHSNPANTAGGIATADLRGLGPQRTIVLIDGRRLGPGDPNTGNLNPAPDLDQIPTALIERVEIVTGGASTTYGSDAVAGVVNFIMKKSFEGIEIDGQYGFDQHEQHASFMDGPESAAGITPPTGSIRDGYKRDLSVLMGTDLDQGAANITGYFIYHDQDGVPGSHRDFSDCDALSNNAVSGVPTQTGFRCHGSFDSNQFIANDDAGPTYSVVGHQFLPYPVSGSVPPPRFSSAPYNYAQRQDSRNQAGFFAHWDIDQSAKPYLEFAFMDDRTVMRIAPSGIFEGQNPFSSDGTYLVNCSNPLLSAQEAATLCTPAQIAADKANPGSASADLDIGRRNVEGGARASTYDHENYRAVAGMDGSLSEGWTYDAYLLYYYTNLFQSNSSYLNYAAIDDALQVKMNAAGQPVCIVGGSCVPYDIFTTGAVTAKQLSYLYETGSDQGHDSEQIAHVDFTGKLGPNGITVPWARDGVALNAGAEHRSETLDFAPDAAELSGTLAGYGGASVPIDQGYSVNEGFLEMRVPIAQDRPASYDLTVDAGYRYSDYSTAGVTNTYKFELQYAPVADVRLRYSYDRVIRAPNLIELYTPLVYAPSGSVGSDPCAPTMGGAAHAQASLAACEHTGVTAAQYGNGFGTAVGGTNTIPQCVAGSCGQVTGGNPHLAPETADTWSLGLSLTPTAFPNLTGSVDYYQIYLKKEIGQVPQTIILQQCLATGNPAYCSDIVRNARGGLSGVTVAGGGYILQNDTNTGAALVSGIDVQANYRRALATGWGTLSASFTGTWLEHNSVAPYAGAESYDCAGLFGNTCLNGSVNPTWRHNLRVSWETPWKLLLSAQWRFIGRSSFDNNSSQPLLQNQEEGFYDPLVTRIPNYSYLDVAAIWTFKRIELRAGVNNLLDKDPPFLPEVDVSAAAGSLNTFPTYDLLGREIFAAFKAKF